MIIVTFAHLGKESKITFDGNHCMTPAFEEAPELEELRRLHNGFLKKDDPKHTRLYNWCKNNFHSTLRGREVFFAI